MFSLPVQTVRLCDPPVCACTAVHVRAAVQVVHCVKSTQAGQHAWCSLELCDVIALGKDVTVEMKGIASMPLHSNSWP